MDRLDVPRIRIVALEPAMPSLGLISTPGSRPASVSPIVWTGAVSTTSSTWMPTRVFPSCFFCWATPAPVTTISSREITDTRMVKLTSADWPATSDRFADWLVYPTRRARSCTWPAGTLANV